MPANKPNKPLRYRQIHLDFHTSEHIPAVGAEFDAKDFVATLKTAHVDSITIFAKCHHGWSYYPTKVGFPHPHLVRPDLMGEMLEACTAADIEAPIYITVQWDERAARERPEWRVVAANNGRFPHSLVEDRSALKQLSPAWHTICLNHKEYRDHVLAQAREVATHYPTQGLFFDIVGSHDCVCNACIKRMNMNGLDPMSARDRLVNDEAVNEQFRHEISSALFEEFPGLRVFYNCGHIPKQGKQRFSSYTHLEIESLPTGGWGYDHFPSSARYAAPLGFDFLGQTGKFHTSWGEFGGFKHPHALEYEIMQMAALGAKCLVGDQLHASGAINHDTYRSIAPAYARVEKMEPFLRGAIQVSEIAILAAEHYHPGTERNHGSDDGAAQMLLELKRPFDVIDGFSAFEPYRLLILPDDVPVDDVLLKKLQAYTRQGGKLLLSGKSGLAPDGQAFAVNAGIKLAGQPVGFTPSYISARKGLDEGLPESPFIAYAMAQSVSAAGATVLADIVPPYFNRSFQHFSSHQHAPDDVAAKPLGPAVTEYEGIAYIAYPIFQLYHDIGQPLYRYIVRGLMERLVPKPSFTTDLPSAGRATLTHQEEENRHVLHLLFATPQIRGKAVGSPDGTTRVMEMIEDIPAIGPVSAAVRLGSLPRRVFDAASGEDLAWQDQGDGVVNVVLPGLHIHRAIVFDGAA
ncbi:beta-galactosidase [Rhizobium sp. Root1203]|uniref:alpha-L-fucosidase n=1 Tax=Rhizobium sp. Root1203 TaxID=1736427 RepID=UPI00070B76A5|nr:alpha-L-fucosidase [Rhizobium sp. Root1203]KQV29288.1 beta-galactosidase [Rhizobium sp. Root1203]